MALRFFDSMAHYNGTTIARKWTTSFIVSWSGSGGRRNAPILGVTGGAITKTLTHQNRYILGAAIQYVNPGAGGPSLTLGNNQATVAQLVVNNDSTVSVFGGNRRIATSTIAVADNTSWHFYEMDTLLGQTGGTVTCTASVRVDGMSFGTFVGASDILVANLIDNAATANTVGIITNGTLRFHDFYCLDTGTADMNGFTSTNTTFLGDVEIDAVFPNADVTTQWSQTGGTGTNAYTAVNDNPPDDDTSYVSTTNTATTSEGFKYQPISGFTGTILGAQYLLLARKDAEGPRIIDMTVGSHTASTIEFGGTSNYLSDFYVYYTAPLDTDFGSAWGTASFGTGGETFGFACIG